MFTDPIAWLSQNVEGFEKLSVEERNGAMHFALIWSLFEEHALANDGSTRAIVSKTKEWVENNRINLGHVAASLEYFRRRYFDGAKFTEYFDGPHGLRFGKGDRKQDVEAVIRGQTNDPEQCVRAVLIIIYRMRNNLLHGEKWKYGLKGQLENFRHANQALMTILSATK